MKKDMIRKSIKTLFILISIVIPVCIYAQDSNMLVKMKSGIGLNVPVNDIQQITFSKIHDVETDQLLLCTNEYSLFWDTIYVDYWYPRGTLEPNSTFGVNSTPITTLDRNKNLYTNTNGNAFAVFFDKDGNYLQSIGFYWRSPILKEEFPENAEKVAFWYYTNSLLGENFCVSKTNNDMYPSFRSSYIKYPNHRPTINIYTTDNEEQILCKMIDAWLTEDCDVVWERGEYHFREIFDLMKTKYGWGTAYELPLGNNCHYYFNNAKLFANYSGTDEDVASNSSLLGSRRRGGDYELYDGELIAENIVYVVHDEAQDSSIPYFRKYKNLNMTYVSGDNSQYLSKCIGGGTGMFGNISIDNCNFCTKGQIPSTPIIQEVSYHGISTEEDCHFYIEVMNCSFENSFGGHNLGKNQTGTFVSINNSFGTSPTFGERWSAKLY